MIVRERASLRARGHCPTDATVFGDACLQACFFAFDTAGMVYLTGDGRSRPIGSFDEFLELLWADPRSLGLADRSAGA
jgi:hypothetical protein